MNEICTDKMSNKNLKIEDLSDVSDNYISKDILDKLSLLDIEEIYSSVGDENAGFTDEQVILLEKHISDNNYEEFNKVFELNKKLSSKIEEIVNKMENLLTEEDINIINNCIISDDDIDAKFMKKKKDFLYPNPMIKNLFELQVILKCKKYYFKNEKYYVNDTNYINYQLPNIDNFNSYKEISNNYYQLALIIKPSDTFPFDCEYNNSEMKISSLISSYDKNLYKNKCAMFIGKRTGFYFSPEQLCLDEISAYHVPTKFSERTSFDDHDNDNASVMRQSILRKMDNKITID